jgi:hypothetical protein
VGVRRFVRIRGVPERRVYASPRIRARPNPTCVIIRGPGTVHRLTPQW